MVSALVTHRPYVVLDGTRVPDTQVMLPLQITIGRAGVAEQPNASSMQFTYYGEVMPDYLLRGKTAEVHTTAASPDLWDDIWNDIWQGDAGSNIGARFIGRITDLGAVLYDVETSTLTVQVTCTGRLAEFGGQIVGDQPWPYESDSERATRIKGLLRAGFTFDASGSRAVRLLPRDVDRQTALDVLHSMGADTGSVLTEYPDGSVHYIGFDQRLTGFYDLLLTETMIRSDVQWQQSAGQLTDRTRVEFGLQTPDVGRPEYVAGNGTHEVHLSTLLADYTSATIVGDAILARWGRADLWEAPTIATDVHLLDQSTYDFILTLVPGRVIWAQGMQTSPGAVDLDGSYWYIEGWQETYDRESVGGRLIHSITYAVSDYRRFAVDGTTPAIVLTVTPTTWGMGNTVTTHAVITAQGGATLPTLGLITIAIDDAQPYFPIDMSGYGPQTSIDIGIVQNQLPPGKHVIRIGYTGWPGQFKPTQSNAVTVTVNDTGFTQATLTTPNAGPHMGEPVTFNVDLFDPTDGTPEGTLTIERSTTVNGPWSTASPILDCPGGDSGMRVSWSWLSDTAGTTYWRCNFKSADTAKWINTLTNVLGVRPLVARTLDITYPSTWQQTYDGAGNPLGAPGAITQGDWGDGHGDQRAFVGYNVDGTAWAGFTITLVEVTAYVNDWRGGAARGVVRLGSHAAAAAPATGTAYTHRHDVTEWYTNTSRRIDVTSWARASLTTGAARGIVFGPSEFPGDPQYAAHIGAGVTNPAPSLHVVGFRWEPS